jgi:hypothetical protein
MTAFLVGWADVRACFFKEIIFKVVKIFEEANKLAIPIDHFVDVFDGVGKFATKYSW